MSDDKMRSEFEAWADSQCLPLTRINWDNGTVSEYAYTATFDAWQVWQAAYQAGQKAEREAIFIEWENGETLAAEVERLRDENEWMGIAGQQMARHLAEAKAELAAANTKTHAEKQNRSAEVNGAVRLLKESREEAERLRGELAEAKAASVCPVEVVSRVRAGLGRCVIECRSEYDIQWFESWLIERTQDNTPPTT